MHQEKKQFELYNIKNNNFFTCVSSVYRIKVDFTTNHQLASKRK